MRWFHRFIHYYDGGEKSATTNLSCRNRPVVQVSDARVGGTEKKPVMAARFELDIHSEVEPYQGLYCMVLTYYGVSGYSDDHQWVIVRLK